MGNDKRKKVEELKENQVSIENLFKGELDEKIPSLELSEIRIFLSATYQDFQQERNYLIEHVYDELRKFCKDNYGIDFILVDLKWGITDEAMNQQLTRRTYIDEVERCQKNSIGPSFIALLSHKYGTRLLKPIISENEFNLIRRETNKFQNIKYKHISSLLEFCYDLDENDLKKVYKLKPINEILSEFKIEKNEWSVQEANLVKSIDSALNELIKTNEITDEQRKSYIISENEKEIQKGLLSQNKSNLKCLAFLRHLNGLENSKSEDVEAFVETEKMNNELLNDLKKRVTEKLKNNEQISIQNLYEYQVDWLKSNKFEEPLTEEIKSYLNKFGDNFKNAVTSLISKNIAEFVWNDYDDLDKEIIHHALFCNNLLKFSTQRDALLKEIKAYLNDKQNNKPFIVSGASGSGKSTLLAWAAKKLKEGNDYLIIRFMGTSRKSENMKSTMNSIIDQMQKIFINKTDARTEFIKKLENYSSKLNKDQKLIIILDSIDQLAKSDYDLKWMIYKLPKNVKIILSVISDYPSKENSILSNLQKHLEYKKNNYLEMEKMHIDQADKIIKEWMVTTKRKLTDKQWGLLNTTLNKSSSVYPLHVKILFNIVSKWTSFERIDEDSFVKCVTIKDTIKYLFKKYETLYGMKLFSHCIFYLTLFGNNGISEGELEDILSLDDDVLTECFKYQHPPIRRFQMALWLKIKYEIKDYLIKKETDGLTVISWFHRSFIEASQEYYESMFNKSEEKDKLLHNVIEYFTEKWNENRSDGKSGEEKPFQDEKKSLENKFKKTNNDNEYMAFRHTKSQKIKVEKRNSENGNKMTVYNKRKLNELLNVIMMLNDDSVKVDLLKRHVYLNYEFMNAKCELKDLDFTIDEHENIMELGKRWENDNQVKELVDLSELYQKIYTIISDQPNQLYIELLKGLKSQSEYVQQFNLSSPLQLVKNNFVTDDSSKNFFKVSDDSLIANFYSEHEGPHVFIHTRNKSSKHSAFHVVDSSNTRLIKSQILNQEIDDNFQILIKTDPKVVSLYVFSSNLIYFSDFESIKSICGSQNGKIKQLLVVHSNYLIIFMNLSMKFLDIEVGKPETIFENEKDDEIQLIESTVPKETVFSSDYLNSVDGITIIVGFKTSKIIRIYRFDSKSKKISLISQVDSIKWNYFGFYESKGKSFWKESCIIQSTFFIDNTNKGISNEALIRFCLEENEEIKVIEIKNNGEFEIKFQMKQLECSGGCHPRLENESKTQLAGFIDSNTLLIKGRRSPNTCLLFVVYIRENKVVKTVDLLADVIHLIDSNGIIFAQLRDRIYVYKVKNEVIDNNRKINFIGQNKVRLGQETHFINVTTENETVKTIKVIESETMVSNKIKNEIKIKNGKILRIEPYERRLIGEIDCLDDYEGKKNEHDLTQIAGILCALDSQYVLVQMKIEESVEKFEMAIIDVLNQIKIKTIVMDDKGNMVKILGCNQDYLVLRESDYLRIYEIKNNQSSFEVVRIYEEEITNKITRFGQWSHGTNKCHFDVTKKKRMVITLLNVDDCILEIREIEADNDDKMQKKKLITYDLKQTELRRGEISCLITDLDNYLVLFDIKYCSTIYLVEWLINSDQAQLIDKIGIGYGTYYVKCFFNSNDLCVHSDKSIDYIQFDSELKKLNKINLKEYKTDEFVTKIENEYLLVHLKESDHIETYKIEDVKRDRKFNNPITIKVEKSFHLFSLSTQSKYLIIGTREKEMIVYRMNDLSKPFACLNLGEFYHETIISNEEYISIIYGIYNIHGDTSFLSFKINDK